jgi:predicted DNA-binding protein
MPGTMKKTRYFLDINPELRNKVKALAALKGKTMKDWITEAIIAKLEDEIDASEGLASLAVTEGTMSLEVYLESRQGESKQAIVPASEAPIKNSLGILKGKTSLVKELAKSRRQDAERGK